MIVRPFDPSKDNPDDVAQLNPWPAAWRRWMALQYAGPFPARNLLVAEEDGQLVGCLHILDGGLPWTVLDGMYLKPAFRSLKNALQLGRAGEDELKRRGVSMFVISAPPQLTRVLQRYGMTVLTAPTLTLLGKVI